MFETDSSNSPYPRLPHSELSLFGNASRLRTRNRIEFERSSLGVARYDSRPRLCRSLSAHSELVNKYVTHPRVTVSLIFPQSQLNSLFDVSRHVVYQSSNTNSQRDPRRQEVRVLQVPGGADDGDPCIAVNEQLRLGGRQRQHNQTFKFEPTLTHPQRCRDDVKEKSVQRE